MKISKKEAKLIGEALDLLYGLVYDNCLEEEALEEVGLSSKKLAKLKAKLDGEEDDIEGDED